MNEIPNWPRMGYDFYYDLDYGTTSVDSPYLTRAASIIEKHNERGLHLDTVQRVLLKNEKGLNLFAIPPLLRKIAGMPQVLKLLNHHLDRAPQSIRALNIALHELAAKRLHRKYARKSVATAWLVSVNTVKKDHQIYGTKAKQILDEMINEKLQPTGGALQTERDVLAALDGDMCDRATFDWLKQRKTARKRGAMAHRTKTRSVDGGKGARTALN